MNAPATTMTGETSLMVRRTFDADIQTLWRALTEAGAWMEWFGADVARPGNAEADLRPGGRWAIGMKGLETGNDFGVGGEFVEIDAPNRVSFTWAWVSAPDAKSLVTYALSDAGEGRTTLTLTHEKLADAEGRDAHGRGWNAALDGLAGLLAR